MNPTIQAAPLTARAFAPYGDVIEISGPPDKIINQGLCGRHHDLAGLDFGHEGRAGLSLFDAQARQLPLVVDMVERHPEGSQAFVPLNGVAMIVVVADDEAGRPVRLQAFISQPEQSINLRAGVWHGVLAPLGAPGRYLVVDRIGSTPNLEEHWFETPWTVRAGPPGAALSNAPHGG